MLIKQFQTQWQCISLFHEEDRFFLTQIYLIESEFKVVKTEFLDRHYAIKAYMRASEDLDHVTSKTGWRNVI